MTLPLSVAVLKAVLFHSITHAVIELHPEMTLSRIFLISDPWVVLLKDCQLAWMLQKIV